MTVLDGPLDDHDGVVQTPLDLGDELLGPSPQQQRARLGLGAPLEQVEPLSTNLLLLEPLTPSQMLLANVGASRLDRSSHGLHHALEVVHGYASGAEDVAVGKVLGGEIADGETGEHDLGAGVGDGLELGVDDGPFGVDDGLVLLLLWIGED